MWYTRATTAAFLMAILTLLVGLAISIVGFRMWYLRVQIYEDAMLRKQVALEEKSTPDSK